MVKRDFTAVYQKRGRWFVAWVEEIPGVNTQGRTLQEARENLKEAVALIVEVNRGLAVAKDSFCKRESLRVSLPA